jgi:hypothetical protein
MSNNLIPKELDNWNLETLEYCLQLTDIESEDFDFKGQSYANLSIHLCAMSNTSGGYLVLGIEEVKNPATNHLIGFKKNGFTVGKDEKNAEVQINNAAINVEPNPRIFTKYIIEGSRFYPIIKIEEISHKKPYLVKGTGICYIRVSSSSVPASRTVIINLVSDLMKKRNSVARLKAASRHLIEQIHYTSTDIERTNLQSDFDFIRPLDLYFFQNAVLDTDWLFIESNMLGGHIGKGTEVGGYYMFHDKLERLNLAINSYNQPVNPFNRQYFLDNRKHLKESQLGLRFWHPGGDRAKEAIAFLEGIIVKCDQFEEKTL